MAQRAKRRRLNTQSNPTSLAEETRKLYSNDPLSPATHLEKDKWNGFCEIESEPALFNVMLREFGVKGVKVQEVVSLDDEMLAVLHKPVYGLIFLFRWREDDPEKQEAICPEGIWFANQTANNACASVALLNIVNNIEGIDLGENLRLFKEFTMPFTPALRGDAINNFEFVKNIHNSFARKMDMLNADLHLRNETTFSKAKPSKNNYNDSDVDAGFHFIAFVPALGKLWKFDGLERQPQARGDCSPDDWLNLAKPDILTRMAEYEEDQIEFSVLGLVRDPMDAYIQELAVNIRCLQLVNRLLAATSRDDTATAFSTSLLENILLGPDALYGLTEEMVNITSVPTEEEKQYKVYSSEELAAQQVKLCEHQKELRASIREEQQSYQADEDYATGRRFDYGPAIRTWVRFLAQKTAIEDLALLDD